MKRILVIDDEPEFLDMLRMRLESEAFEVFTAPDGKAGIAKARDVAPDLILLDVMMPDKDGGDVAHELRLDPRFRNTPIIFLTAAITYDEMQRSQHCIGDDVYLSKTAGSQTVLALIRKYLDAG